MSFFAWYPVIHKQDEITLIPMADVHDYQKHVLTAVAIIHIKYQNANYHLTFDICLQMLPLETTKNCWDLLDDLQYGFNLL